MTTSEFDSLCESLEVSRRAIVLAKRPEYTEGHSDVLRNFKAVAAELNLPPRTVWYIYFRKHVASISQFCKPNSPPMSEPIISRISDAMNYLELLAAIIEDESN